jgi:hypothetical protein
VNPQPGVDRGVADFRRLVAARDRLHFDGGEAGVPRRLEPRRVGEILRQHRNQDGFAPACRRDG